MHKPEWPACSFTLAPVIMPCMLGKPLVLITLSALQRPLTPLSLQRHPQFLPFLNRSALYYLLRHCRQAGLDTVVLLLDQSLYQQLEHVRQQIAALPLRVEWILYSGQDQRGLKALKEHLNEDDPVLLFQNPCFDLLDINQFLKFHQQQQADCSLRLSPEPGWNKSPVYLDAEAQVISDADKQKDSSPKQQGYDTRCYLIEPDIFEGLLDQPFQILNQPLLPALLDAAEYTSGQLSDKLWADWHTAKDFFKLQHRLLEKQLLDPEHRRLLRHDKATVWLGEDVSLGKDVNISGPVLIGDQVQIESGVTIQGPAIIGSRSRIQANSQINQCWIWPDCRIASGSQLKNGWLGEQVLFKSECLQTGIWAADHSKLYLSQTLPAGTVLGPDSILEL